MTDQLRWGILGTANIARAAVIPAIHAPGNGTAAAVASRVGGRARAFAAAARIPVHHGSYEDLLADGGVDAIYLPLPNSLHREWTIRAAEAGKHILCEKPLALTASECREMDAAARGNGVRLMEAFMYRFHPRIDEVLRLIASGVIGQLRSIRSAFSFRINTPGNIRLDAALGGGALMDVGCYCVNASRTLAGAEPLEVWATATWADTGVDSELTGMLRFPDGLVAHFDCALTVERRESCEVAGTAGSLVIDPAFLPGAGPVTIVERHGREAPVEHRLDGVDQYRVMVEHFADAVLGGHPFRYEPAEAAAGMAVLEALYRSARAGGAPERVEPG